MEYREIEMTKELTIRLNLELRSVVIGYDDEIKLNQHILKGKDQNECWVWVGYSNKKGYGVFTCTINGLRGSYLVHRIMYFIHNKIDPKTMLVLHECDNPICCNPKHLKLGSYTDNQRDAKIRGRRAEQNGLNNGLGSSKSSLTEEQVKEILQLNEEGLSNRKIAFILGLTKSTVGYICQRRTYKNVEVSH